MSIHLGIKINEALSCSMEVWKIVPPRKVLSFNLEKQLLDDERTTKQQTYSLPGMTNALADLILKKLRFSHPHIVI